MDSLLRNITQEVLEGHHAGGATEDVVADLGFDADHQFLEDLVGFGPRVAGGSAEEAAADYIAAQMESYGLDVTIQEFLIDYFEELSPPLYCSRFLPTPRPT